MKSSQKFSSNFQIFIRNAPKKKKKKKQKKKKKKKTKQNHKQQQKAFKAQYNNTVNINGVLYITYYSSTHTITRLYGYDRVNFLAFYRQYIKYLYKV